MYIFCGTYNVNCTPPGFDLIKKWILKDDKILPHIVCIGFQELVNLKVKKNFFNSFFFTNNIIIFLLGFKELCAQ